MTTAAERCRLLVDTDAGLDDALALTYLARHPGAALVAVGSVHGNVPALAAANNALRVLELAGDTTTPVAVGAEHPLNQPVHLGHPDDPVGTLAGPPARRPSREPAADQLARLARQQPGALTVLALGPLTNLALALRAEPALPRLLHHVVIMGGALSVSGNTTPQAESNIWHDPEAADAVLAAGFACTLVPLDVTRRATATRDWLTTLAAGRSHLWGQAAAALLHHHREDSTLPSLPLHDPLAAAITLDPNLAEYDHHPLRVELQDASRGKTTLDIPDGQRRSVAIATDVDVNTFRTRLLDVLTRESPVPW